MTILDELKIFVRTIAHKFYAFVGFSFFFFIFGFKEVFVFGGNYILLLPTENSFSVQFFNMVRSDLLPKGVELITTNPMSAFMSQILFAIMLSFLLTIPFLLYKIVMYIKPALLPHEKKAVMLSLLPLVSLFFCGALFSYFFLIPTTFKVLYPYATAINVLPFFSIDEFVYYIFSLMIAVGMMFLLPMFMILLSFLGIIEANFWKRKWKYAFLFFLILSAIITPDGTGITMAILFIPLMTLYFGGYVFANKLSLKQYQ